MTTVSGGSPTAMAEHLLTRLAQLDSTALAHILLQHAPALSTPIRTILTQLAHAQLRASCVPAEAQLEVAGQGQQGRVLVSLATVLRRALSRGDPSLARMLLPGTPALVDLAIAIGTLHSHAGTNDEAAATASKTLRAALRALVDPHLAAEILSALHSSLKSAVLQPFGAQQLLPSATNLAQASPSPLISTLLDIQKRARMLALLLRALPLTGYNTSSFSSEGKKDPYTAVLAQLAQDLGALHDVVLPALTRAAQAEDTSGAGAALAAAQTHMRDAALSLLLLFRPSSGAHAAGASTAVSTIVAQLKPASSTASPAVAGATLVDAIRARFLADSETAWDELMVALKKNASPASLTAAPTELLNVPDVLLSALRKHQQRLGAQLNGARARKGKARAMKKDKQEAPPIDPALLATVQSVLPHLDTPSLGRRLQRSKYAGKSAEQVIDLLLESTSGNEDDDDDENGAETEEEDGDYEGSRDLEEAVPYEPPAPIVRAAPARRANIFDDAGPLDLSKFRYKSDMPSLDSPAAASLGGAAAKGGLHAIPSALKASVLARVAAQQREELEEEEEDEEDGETGLGRGVREAGFEEELETDEAYLARNGDGFDWIGRRGMTSALASAPSGPIGRGAGAGTGRVPNAREWRRRIEDESDEDEDEVGDGDADENAHSGGGPSTAGVVPPAPTPGTSGSSSAASERAADRILTRYYAQYGAALFARNDPALRKGNNPLGIARRQLLAELERETGKSWDGGLVESWGTMFERNVSAENASPLDSKNRDQLGICMLTSTGRRSFALLSRALQQPRKDRLLAKSTDLLGPNPNRPAAPDAATAAAGAAAGEGASAGGRQFGPDRGRGGRIIRGVGARGGGRGGGGTGGGGSSGSGSGSANGPGKGQHSGSNRAARQKEKRGSSARFRGRGGGMARSGAFPAGVGE
ncbi:hypothetical protein OC842_005517 [Tilletia horrida]|uniref:Uncharacterized protein n=1 Tax=Tilletia horrida TaxID=155126 RepID=A0AAN6JIJ4_9BASI|nr:hypothetical protein OC842_005517 [Tilletia horrida]